jgi:hypothetical protein
VQSLLVVRAEPLRSIVDERPQLPERLLEVLEFEQHVPDVVADTEDFRVVGFEYVDGDGEQFPESGEGLGPVAGLAD